MAIVTPRIIGLETEYSLLHNNPSMSWVHYNVADELLRPISQDYNAFCNFMENGSRLYSDHGEHPEYATPETDNIKDAVIYDKAGEKILYGLCAKLEDNMMQKGDERKVRLIKNNSHKGQSWGCHENYLASRNLLPFSYFSLVAMPFLVARTVYSGAGKSGPTIEDYEISGRAEFISKEIGITTTSNRPIINTRDEPHADIEKYLRIHLIYGDSNMLEYSTMLKLGTTSIVISLMEDKLCPKLYLAEPVNALHAISKDYKLEQKYYVGDKKNISAVQILREYFSAAEKVYPNIGEELQDNTLEKVMEEWDFTLTALEKRDFNSLIGKIDWITKTYLIDKEMSRKGKDGQKNSYLFDLMYSRIYPAGLGQLYFARSPIVERICTDAEIEKAMRNPPQTTRALSRSRHILSGLVESVSWDNIKLKNGRTLSSKDPREIEYQ